MKIKTWIKYEESYLPPRCRKLRYRECEEYVNANLKEVRPEQLKLAFEDNSYEGKGKIYYYKGKLWTKDKVNPSIMKDLQERGINVNSALDCLIYWNENSSTYFFSSYDREYYGMDTSRTNAIKQVNASMKGYILVDGDLYTKTAEPRYCIYTFGLGHNHGGTALSVDYRYNPNISKKCYFSALDGKKAVKEANETAARRGDINDVGRFKAKITVYMPELVKVKPNRQHGNGNEFHNMMESVIDNSSNPNDAAVTCMCLAMMNV